MILDCAYAVTRRGERYCVSHEHSGRYVPQLNSSDGIVALFTTVLGMLPKLSKGERVKLAHEYGIHDGCGILIGCETYARERRIH